MSHGAGFPATLIWPLLILAAIVTGVPVLAIGAAIALRARSARASVLLVTGGEQIAAPVWRQARRWGTAGLAAGVVLGLLLFAAGRAWLTPLACAGGYLAGLLAEQFTAQPAAPRGHLRAASLQARRGLDYGPRWAFAAATAAAALVAMAPLAFALAPAVRYRNWQPLAGAGFTLPGGTTAWPGLAEAVPTALAALAVLLLGLAGLRRIASRPPMYGPAAPGQPGPDGLTRRQAGRAIAGAVLGFELMALAATLISGSSGLAVPVRAVAPGAYLGNRLMIASGVCCAIAALISWLMLSGRMSRRRQAAGQSEAGPVTPPGD